MMRLVAAIVSGFALACAIDGHFGEPKQTITFVALSIGTAWAALLIVIRPTRDRVDVRVKNNHNRYVVEDDDA